MRRKLHIRFCPAFESGETVALPSILVEFRSLGMLLAERALDGAAGSKTNILLIKLILVDPIMILHYIFFIYLKYII